jgi:tetratricopeptide (TPR) repeat protein
MPARLLLCSLAILVSGVSLGFARSAASPSASLNGVVYSEATNQRIRHATVWFCDASGNRLQESISTDSGEFSFVGIPAGTFLLKVEAADYVPASVQVDVNFGTQHGVSIFLKPVEPSAKKPRGDSAISAHELSISESARALMDSGKQKLYGDKKPAEALRDFQTAVAKAPDYYEACYQIGMANLALQNSVEAEKNLQKAVELSDQTFADADFALATLLLARHDAMRGEPLLLRGLDLDPNSWSGFFQLGKLELYRNHLDAALVAAEKARTLAPEQALVYRLLSLIHMRQHNDSAAVADLDAYIRLDPDSPDGLTAKRIRADTQSRIDKAHGAPLAAANAH